MSQVRKQNPEATEVHCVTPVCVVDEEIQVSGQHNIQRELDQLEMKLPNDAQIVFEKPVSERSAAGPV